MQLSSVQWILNIYVFSPQKKSLDRLAKYKPFIDLLQGSDIKILNSNEMSQFVFAPKTY